MLTGQRVERAGRGLIHTRDPLRASAFAEPKVEIPLIGPWGPDGMRVQVIPGSRTEAAPAAYESFSAVARSAALRS